MNLIPKFLRRQSTPAERPVVVRRQPKMQSRKYAGAETSRLLSDWVTQSASANSDIRQGLTNLRARSRDLAINNDYGSKFFKFDKFANDTLEAAWKDWGRRGICTVDGKLSFAEAQRLVAKTVARDGEILVRKIVGRSAGNKYQYALQLLDADYLDTDLNGVDPRIEMGVEFDTFGRPVAYHMFTAHPGAEYLTSRQVRQRIPAKEIIHVFKSDRPEQARGVPWIAPSMFRLKMLGGYEEAEVVAARIAASKMGFFLTETGEEYEGDGEDDDGNITMEAEPGLFESLPTGVKSVETFDPSHPGVQYSAFVKGVLRGAASGMGVSYTSLANDLEGVNYSSIRQGKLDERDEWRESQEWFIDTFLSPVWESWLETYLGLSGLASLPLRKYDKFNAPHWVPRGWQWVDPMKEVKANVEAVAAGFKSKTDVLAEQGKDLEETLEQIKVEQELEESLGLNKVTPEPEEAPANAPDDEDD